ncbi:MAG: hypothetical protein FXF54_09450 [Kosmotoga sp.]|nr:MAG: hypothetical protein FXF54_09450 [Kosmotoga sp.]
MTYRSEEVIKYIHSKKKKGKPYILREEIINYITNNFPKTNSNTLRRRISDLKRDGIITKVDKNAYYIGNKPQYFPSHSKFIEKLNKNINEHFPYLDSYCIWNTQWLNEFTTLQSDKSMLIIEVERGIEDAMFDYLSDSHENVYIKPTRKEVERYILPNKDSVVVKPLITNSPIIKKENLQFPKLEKILVDLFCDSELFMAYQGNQLLNIYTNSIKKYAVNRKTLLAYAKRRRKENRLKDFLNDILDTKWM